MNKIKKICVVATTFILMFAIFLLINYKMKTDMKIWAMEEYLYHNSGFAGHLLALKDLNDNHYRLYKIASVPERQFSSKKEEIFEIWLWPQEHKFKKPGLMGFWEYDFSAISKADKIFIDRYNSTMRNFAKQQNNIVDK